MQARDCRLDLAKGVLIALVVIGHSFFYGYFQDNIHQDTFIYKLIYSFHMPAFMLLSGYFFYNSNKKPLMNVVLSKIKSVGVPFFAFTVVMWILMHIKTILFTDEFSLDAFSLIIDLFDYVLTSKVMWYIASLFINCIYLFPKDIQHIQDILEDYVIKNKKQTIFYNEEDDLF